MQHFAVPHHNLYLRRYLYTNLSSINSENIHHAIQIYKRMATHKFNRRPSPIIFKFRIATFKNVEL